eukprot:315100-Chlamydomonas_euryale.AAC.9
MGVHPLSVATPGCTAAPAITGTPCSVASWQVVALLIEHGKRGSIGLVLNRPTGMVMGRGRKPNGMPFQLSNAPSTVQSAFAESRLYCGGFEAQHVIHLVHGHTGLEGSVEIVPGIYTGGEVAAAEAVAAGRAVESDFRFFAGAIVWEPGELAAQAASGAWYPAAAARALALKQCLQLPTPLWREVLLLMGGKYARVAQEDDLF